MPQHNRVKTKNLPFCMPTARTGRERRKQTGKPGTVSNEHVNQTASGTLCPRVTLVNYAGVF